MINKTLNAVCYLVVFTVPVYAQLALDTLLFTIPLTNNTLQKTLFINRQVDTHRKALTGPVVMEDDNLLFYSENGYVLYDQGGSIVDSYSVFKRNRHMAKNSPELIRCAYPITPNTLLFYTNAPHEKYQLTIFKKKLFRGTIKPLPLNSYEYYKDIGNRYYYNLVFNPVTDDMLERYCIIPRLVGFTSLNAGEKWWSVDKFYSFSSPVIHEEEEELRFLFPGIQLRDDKMYTVDPLQMFSRDSQCFYAGIYSHVGTKAERYYQTYFVCDQAGNVLYTDTLLKRDNMDAIIGEDEETYYTMKKVKRHVFIPTITQSGDVFYGIMDYTENRIEVRKRQYYMYKAFPTEPKQNDLIENEKCVEFVALTLGCKRKSKDNLTLPKITVFDAKKKKFVRADKSHLTKQGYICYITRSQNRDLKKKLTRSRGGVPRKVRKMIDSLSRVSTVTCPYSLELQGAKGTLRSFMYPPGDEIVCARVMAKCNRNELLVRVDCRTYAEALIFRTDGTFLNRFIFNRQNYENRLDMLVVSNNGSIVEVDYEADSENFTYLEWRRCLP